MTRSELLTPSVSECPSPLGLEFPSREKLGGFLERKLEHSEKLETQSLKNSRKALEQQRGMMMGV